MVSSDIILLLRSLWLEEACADLGGRVCLQLVIGVHGQADRCVSLLFILFSPDHPGLLMFMTVCFMQI